MPGETEPMLASATAPIVGGQPAKPDLTTVRSMRLEQAAKRCNDWFFAALFLATMAVVAVFAFWKGLPVVWRQYRSGQLINLQGIDSDYLNVFAATVGLIGVSILLSAVWMKLLMSCAIQLIRVALWFNVALLVVFGGVAFTVNLWLALGFLGLAALSTCFVLCVGNRLAFASANLKTACAAVGDHLSIYLVALFMVIKQFLWIVLWMLSLIGVHMAFKQHDPACNAQNTAANETNIGIPHHLCGGTAAGVSFFFMLIAMYWAQQVMLNVLTCTTAGTVSAWWYKANSRGATLQAYCRALSTSFGSICFGSLIVAILEALRTVASALHAEASEDGNVVLACVSCVAECILNCLNSLLEYFNKWAYVYVGVYGYDFKTSGKAVMDLFGNRGWTAVINDNLTSTALTFGAVVIGIVCCVLGLLIVKFSPIEWFDGIGSRNAGMGVVGTIGFIAGASNAMLMANVVITALDTVFVCFAEDPVVFSRNHPEEYETLISAWREFHGESLSAAYGTTV